MPLLLLALLLGVLVFSWASRRGKTLTRMCRWRQDRDAGQWHCAACGAVQSGAASPRDCLRNKAGPTV